MRLLGRGTAGRRSSNEQRKGGEVVSVGEITLSLRRRFPGNAGLGRVDRVIATSHATP